MCKIALISGTRTGIGKELALHLLGQEFTVVGCSRGGGDIEHRAYMHYNCDVSKEDQVIEMCRDVATRYGRIDVLINNAGIASMNHLLLTPTETAIRVMETNYIGSFLFTREVGKIMARKKHGRIVNMTTVARALNLEGEAVYASSKAAVETLTQISAIELAPLGITVNALGVSPFPSNLTRTVPEESMELLIERQAIKRVATIGDITNVVDFFINDDSAFVTGQIVYLGGVLA